MQTRQLDYSYAKKNSYHYLILMILKKEHKSMKAIQITEKIKKLKKIKGKTPDATIRSLLQRSSYVEPVGNGFWKLKSGVKITIIE